MMLLWLMTFAKKCLHCMCSIMLHSQSVCGYLSLPLCQVSHHPPMFAMHVEHKDWTLWEEYTVASKFRGKYVACYPIGITHLIFHNNG